MSAMKDPVSAELKAIKRLAKRMEVTIIGCFEGVFDLGYRIVGMASGMDIIGGMEITTPKKEAVCYLCEKDGIYRVGANVSDAGSPALFSIHGVVLKKNINVPEEDWNNVLARQVMEEL